MVRQFNATLIKLEGQEKQSGSHSVYRHFARALIIYKNSYQMQYTGVTSFAMFS